MEATTRQGVLVVASDGPIREAVAKALDSAGYIPLTADSREDGLDVTNGVFVHAVVLDLPPYKQGEEYWAPWKQFFRDLQAYYPPSLPTVVLVQQGNPIMDDANQLAREVGLMKAVLPKPVSLGLLVQTVTRLVGEYVPPER